MNAELALAHTFSQVIPMARARNCKLALHSLEERATPAAIPTYVPGNRTLTIVAGNNDQISVESPVGSPPGYLKVTELVGNTVVFDSSAPAGRAVTNLIVRFDKVANGTVTVSPTTRIGGLLGVFGATGTQSVSIAGTIGGDVTYVPTKDAVDTVAFEASTQVGGKVNVKLGNGDDSAEIKGGFFGGDVLIQGGLGGDTVRLLQDFDVRISGTATFALGNGNNNLISTGGNLLDVGKNFVYKGGTGTDTVSLRTVNGGTNSVLRTGGDMLFTLDNTPIAGGANELDLNRVTAGGKISIIGGAGSDNVEIAGDVTTGGDLSLSLLDGSNYLNTNANTNADHRIGGNFSYKGGIHYDYLYLDGATIGKGVTVDLGKSDVTQGFEMGNYIPVTVLGSVKIVGGNKRDTVSLHRTFIGGKLSILTAAGNDAVEIDDVLVSGFTFIGLGDDWDTLDIETQLTDASGDLDGRTLFGGRLHVKADSGSDTITLGADDADAFTAVTFGDLVRLEGGDFGDTLNVGTPADTLFLIATGNTDVSFENGDHLV